MEETKLWMRDKSTYVPNHILKFIINNKNPTDHAIVMLVARWSKGFHRADTGKRLSLEYFGEEIGVDKTTACSRIKTLLNNGVIFRGDKRGDDYKYSLFDVFSQANSVASDERSISSGKKHILSEEKLGGALIAPGETTPLKNKNNNEIVNLQNPVNKDDKERLEKIYIGIFNHWNSKAIMLHCDFEGYVESIKTAIDKGYSPDGIKNAIDNYKVILDDSECYLKYRWRLDRFLDKNIDGFADLETAKQSYRKSTRQSDDEDISAEIERLRKIRKGKQV